jgi:gluconate 2-dehydrogenase gamma chain
VRPSSRNTSSALIFSHVAIEPTNTDGRCLTEGELRPRLKIGQYNLLLNGRESSAVPLTRREWILGSVGLAIVPQVLLAQQHAVQAVQAVADGHAVAFEYLDASAARVLSALAAEIIPSDDGPGATEAGVVYFIDRTLATFDADKREQYKKGLRQVEVLRSKLFPRSTSIEGLTREQCRELIRGFENSEFFEALRTHVVLGFLANPEYGGNRGKAGWRYIDFDDQMVYEPPFGYYDAHQNGEAK